MRFATTILFSVTALSLMLVNAPSASAQYRWYGGYYDDDFYEDDWYYDYYTFRGANPERGVEQVLDDPYAEWEYEALDDEWEIESMYGEVDYEPEGYFEPSSRQQLERAIRRELRGPGTWDYEPLEGEWDYETPSGDIEYEPGPRY